MFLPENSRCMLENQETLKEEVKVKEGRNEEEIVQYQKRAFEALYRPNEIYTRDENMVLLTVAKERRVACKEYKVLQRIKK